MVSTPGTFSTVAVTAGSGTPVETITTPAGNREEVVAIGDGRDSIKATVFDAGFLRVSDEPHQLFYDPFDAAPDTTNTWTTANAGGGAAPAVTAGTLALGTGTTAGGTSSIVSIPTFKPTVPAWLGVSFAIAIPDLAAPTAQTYRFWGMGSAAGTTVAGPTDGVGFELTTAGHMVCVVYTNGSRTAVADLFSVTQPTDALNHRYGVYVRTDKAYWFIDTLDNVVASSQFQAPAIQTLPVKMLAVAGTTPGSSGLINCVGLAVWDTGKNAVQIADGTFPWRRQKVDKDGNASVRVSTTATSTLTQPAISTTSASILSANANRLGAIIFNDATTTLYLALTASAATTSAYSVQLAAQQYYEVPFGYTGAITGILATGAASGNARVTELVT